MSTLNKKQNKQIKKCPVNKDNKGRMIISILSGPIGFFLCLLTLQSTFGFGGSVAIGTTLWMATWWIMRPVNIAVTAMLPVAVNAIFNVVPMPAVLSQYASEVVVLLFGANLVCLTWATTGLDKRLSLKALSVIGTSMKQQILVWTFASAILSIFLPNAVVCTIMTPVAVSMLAYVGDKEVSKSAIAVPILLSIAYGSGIGGAGSPLGGAMNLVAISYMEEYTGQEFMYIDWVVRMLPFLIVMLAVISVYLFSIKLSVKHLDGTKEYFQSMYKDLGKMKKGEKISAMLFLAATTLAFIRPLYAEIIPMLKPAFSFLLFGMLTFFFRDDKNKPLLEWKHAEKEVMWGMLFLFAGGLALGKMVSGTGATAKAAELISQANLTGGLMTIAVFVAFAALLAEVSSNTAAAAIAVPVVMSITLKLGLNPVPYWFITSMAFNSAFVLPLTVRAVPVGYGMDVSHLFKKGAPLALICMVVITVAGYLFMTLWPMFSTLPYLQ